MMRIAALNDSSSESSNEEDIGPSQEALEADASRVYRKAISHLAKNEIKEAKESLFEVLNNPYIARAEWNEEFDRCKVLPQDIALKYSSYKNLGNLYMTEKLYSEASDFYMKALHLDSTEVTLWQKLGASAIKIKDFQLALVAFQEGLLVNPNHWPCMDQLLSVLFLLGFYEDCLSLAIQTLKRDSCYVKALAFKDYIFEKQASLIDFAKEFFKESELLFGDVVYDKAKGDKFISTCLELRPAQKPARPPSPPIPPRKVAKSLNKFNWVELADALIHTYDELVHDEPRAIVGKLEVEPVIKEYVDLKVKTAIKENLKNDLTNVFKPGRRLSRSLSYNDDLLSKRNKSLETGTGDLDGQKDTGLAESLPVKPAGEAIPKRRQTIELGEGQESFRVGSRRSSADSELAAEVSQDKMEVEETAEKNETKDPSKTETVDKETEKMELTETDVKVEHKKKEEGGKDEKIEQSKKKDTTQVRSPTEDSKENTKIVIEPTETQIKQPIPAAQKVEIKRANESERTSQDTATNRDCKDDKEKGVKTGDHDKRMEKVDTDKKIKSAESNLPGLNGVEELMTGEPQAAVNQLKDIMALKPPTGILKNLSHSEFEFDQDYCEYFDGGVYEEDEEEDDDDEDEEMETEDNTQSDEVKDNKNPTDQKEPDDEDIEIVLERTGKTPQAKTESTTDDLTTQKTEPTSKEGQPACEAETETDDPCVVILSTADVDPIAVEVAHETPAVVTPAAAAAAVPKKPKRYKRGLERELEQLDYWGRRKAREAKRRRRTLTSRLVGLFDDTEYLTWAHLIRSFIPAALLSSADDGGTSKEFETGKTYTGDNRAFLQPGNKSKATAEAATKPQDKSENNKCATKNETKATDKENLTNYKFLEQYTNLLDTSQWSLEELEVGEFLQDMKENGGVVEVMQRCLRMMIKNYDRSWPLKSASAYTELYFRIREHITVGATLSLKEDPEELFEFANAALTQIELLLNLNTLSDQDFPCSLKELLSTSSLHLEDDLFHLELLLSRPDVWKEAYLQAHLRVTWAHAQVEVLKGRPEEGAQYLYMLIEEMRLATRDEEDPSPRLEIERCKIEEDATQLTLDGLKNQLNVLQRSQMLEKIESKFESGYYQEVVQILGSIFHDYKTVIDKDTSLPPRHMQLTLLVDSLVKMEDVKGLVEWGSLCLNEAVKNFQSDETEDEDKKMWNEIIQSFLCDILDVVSDKADQVCNCDREHVVKMILCLVNVLVLQLEEGSGLPQPYFNTLSPWIILHLILSRYEKSQALKTNEGESKKGGGSGVGLATIAEEEQGAPNEDSSEKEKVGAPSPSTLLLITAHEELGKNSWCCFEDGSALLYTLDVLCAEMEAPLAHEQRTIVRQAVEQVMFCLFAHPSRKTKVSLLNCKYKHLRDHGGQSIPLTWKRSLQLYKFYLPHQLPEFQSSEFPSITDDVAVLFRRILSLMPDHFKHQDQIKDINAYIEGDIPSTSLTPLSFPPEIKDLYYLLADKYFKGKEWEQAIQYYKWDVSVNPNRMDSWAPMGLAKKAQLETLLNSCEVIKNDEEFFKEAQRAKRCLDRGLLLDQYFSNLWVEKGGLVYMIHSHASRLLNQDLNPDMSIEMFESLEKIKSEMLIEASKCFSEALKIVDEGWEDYDLTDERWLYQYMLGKLAEKMGKPPSEVLSHYLDAFKRLDDIGATYPEKINYNNAADYSVEALEVYFRINVYIFKYLNQREGKDVEPKILDFLTSVLEKVAMSPFVLCKEKSEEQDDPKSTQAQEKELSVVEESNTRKRPCEEEGEQDGETPKKQKSEDKDFIENMVCDSVDEALDTSLNKEQEGEETEKGKDESAEKPDAKMQEQLDDQREQIVLECLNSFNLCVCRFSHHYKSLYRIAYFYHHSKSHKENRKARNALLGCSDWHQLSYMPSNGLFNERKISLQNPKNSSLFHGVWRIPHDEIDRPGSFAAHMYRCVSLCLDILQEMKDFYTVLEIAYSLRNSPDKDKKYLRDNERELLSEHATQVGIQTMKDKFRFLFKSSSTSPPRKSTQHSFLIDVYKAYKQMSRHLPISESPFSKVLIETYIYYAGVLRDGSSNILRDAENFCIRNPSSVYSSGSSGTGYQSGLRMGSPTPSTGPVVIKRGRPPTGSRDLGSLRFVAPHDSKPTVGQTVAVQQAYKVYENLIQAQTILNKKTLDGKSLQFYQDKYEEYKQQMLKYLQIQSVSQFFHSSLQSIGTSTAKLPPPPTNPLDKTAPSIVSDKTEKPIPTTVVATSSPQGNPSISSLAAKSKAHGISISAVSKKAEHSVMKPAKPNMSITLSQATTTSTNSTNKVSISNISKETNDTVTKDVTTITHTKMAANNANSKELNTTKPKELTTIKPTEVCATKSKEMTNTKSKERNTTMYKEVDSLKPKDVVTIKPVELSTLKSKEVPTTKPKDMITMSKEVITIKPTLVKPKEVGGTMPKEDITIKPKEVITITPKEICSTKPKEVITITHKEANNTKPKNVVTVRPKEASNTKPKEVITITPKEGCTSGPKEAIITKLKDVTMRPKETGSTKPKEVITITPKEAGASRPKETNVTKPKDIVTIRSTKEVSVTKPKDTSTTQSPPKTTTVSNNDSSLPKLPHGTTLSRQPEGAQPVRPKKSEDPTTMKSRLDSLTSSISAKGGVTITPASKQASAAAASKKRAIASFQDAFQASLAKSKLSSNNVTVTSPGKDTPVPAVPAVLPKKGIKVSSLKFLKPGDNKMWESLASSISGKASTSTSISSGKTSASITSTKPSSTSIAPAKPSSTSVTSTKTSSVSINSSRPPSTSAKSHPKDSDQPPKAKPKPQSVPKTQNPPSDSSQKKTDDDDLCVITLD